MIYETVKTISLVFCPSLHDLIDVDVFYTIYVEDGSFDHDWAGGGTEHRTEVCVENTYWSFQYKGKAVLFDPESGYASLLGDESYLEDQLRSAEASAVFEAIHAFEHPENFYDV
jgi:hypothetical protein